MEGPPAGWYDDPEQPGQQRWWDGNAWTDQRAPAGAAPAAAAGSVPPADPAAPPTGAAPTMPPPGAPAPPGTVPPPPATPAKSSRKGLWIALIVVAVVFVGIIAAIAAVAVLGGDSATDVVDFPAPLSPPSTTTPPGSCTALAWIANRPECSSSTRAPKP